MYSREGQTPSEIFGIKRKENAGADAVMRGECVVVVIVVVCVVVECSVCLVVVQLTLLPTLTLCVFSASSFLPLHHTHSPLAPQRYHILRVAATVGQFCVFCRGHVQRIDQQVDARDGPPHARLATHRLALFIVGAHADPSQCDCRVFELVRTRCAYTRPSSCAHVKHRGFVWCCISAMVRAWWVDRVHSQAGHEVLSTLGAVNRRCGCHRHSTLEATRITTERTPPWFFQFEFVLFVY